MFERLYNTNLEYCDILICYKERWKIFSHLVIFLEVIGVGTAQLCDRFQNMELHTMEFHMWDTSMWLFFMEGILVQSLILQFHFL